MKTTLCHIAYCLGLIMIVIAHGQAQVIYVPVNHPVYDYLERMTVKSVIEWDGVEKPYSRMDVARLLAHISGHRDRLSQVERDELEYYEREFNYELITLGFHDGTITPRWNLFSYRDSIFSIVLDPVLGETVSKEVTHRFNGAKFYGQLSSGFAFGFHFNDNQETGKNIDPTKQFVPETGINVVKSTGPQEIEYDDVRAYVAYGTERLQLFFGKDFVKWGSGARGKLILSDKAPSFPMIRLLYTPTSWLRFHYLHGWLESLVLDSLRTYQTQLARAPRNIYREKYIAAHMLSLTLARGLDLSFGESIIYSDGSPNTLFLIPVMFFRAADHYLTHHKLNDGSNSQFFLDVAYNFLSHARVYGTLFIDEIVPSAIFDSQKARNQLGFSLGSRWVNPFMENVDVTCEYTRILPWVYSNSVQTQVFENAGYLLGHYIGQNADQIYTDIRWRPLRGLEFSAYYDYVRRGGKTDIEKQYELPSLPFLYGNIQRTSLKGVSVQYDYLHDLRGKCDFYWQDPYVGDASFNFRIGIEYGLYTN